MGFLGVGSVARYHAEVLPVLGHVVSVGCGTNVESPRWQAFKSVAPQARFETEGCSLLENPEIDAVVACLPWNVAESWLPELLSTPKPVLLEKPIALSSRAISDAIAQSGTTLDNKFVGFNRRFYRTVQTLKGRVNQGGLKSVEITISETVDALAKMYGEEIIDHILVCSSSHILDAAFHVLGRLRPIRNYVSEGRASPSGFLSLFSLLETDHGAPVFLTILAENPVPVGIRVFFDDQTTWHLSPMERLVAYRGYDRIEPTLETKIRRYAPKPFLEIDENSEFKPGFLDQMRAFTQDEGHNISASPQESLELTGFIENMKRLAAS